MEGELRARLRERREKAALADMETSLSGVLTGRRRAADSFPALVQEAIRGFWHMSAEPEAWLSDDANADTVDRWIVAALARHGIVGTAWVATHLGVAPWIECGLEGSDWPFRVRAAVQDPWIFVAPSMDVVAAVTEAEYSYEFHAARIPASGR